MLLVSIASSGELVVDTFTADAAERPRAAQPWFLAVAAVIGVAAFVVVRARRRRPLAVVLTLALAGIVSPFAAGPALLALVSVATRRFPREIAIAGTASLAASMLGAYLVLGSSDPWWQSLVLNTVWLSATIGWGMYIGSRRELLWTLRQRAERAEAERDLRAGAARTEERARIAR